MAGEKIVYNHDVVAIYNRTNRFKEELIKCVSSNLSSMSKYDIDRLESYLNAIDKHHDWVISQPALDLPETSPREYVLEPAPSVPDIENEDVGDLVRLLGLAADELINSQSARLGSGLVSFDSARLRTITDKSRKFLNDYIKVVSPLDLPESSPATAVTGPGRGGV